MELIIISDKKMKIMLTEKELYRYNLDSENFSLENDAQRHAFRRVLNDACRQSGFENKHSRLMVQMYPGKKGGCEIFVTRMESGDGDSKKASLLSPISIDLDCCETNGDVACYSFGCFSYLNVVCRQLQISGFAGNSNAYVSSDGTYYLVLSGFFSKNTQEKPYTDISFINEFAKGTGLCVLSFAEEYCKKICDKNAVKLLGNI